MNEKGNRAMDETRKNIPGGRNSLCKGSETRHFKESRVREVGVWGVEKEH